MQNTDGFYPPLQYGTGWFTAGVLLLVAVAVWFGFLGWRLYFAKPKTTPPVAMAPQDLAALRAKYLVLIAEVESKVHTRSLTARAAHQQLSLLVRYFAYEAAGFRAQVLTLSDLQQSQFPAVADAVGLFYPAEFAAVEHGDIATSIAKAKEVVSSWS